MKLEEKIFEILEGDKNLECKYNFTQDTEEESLINLCSNTAKAKEITSMMEEFIMWFIKNEYFWGGLCEQIMTPIIGLPEFNTIDELFDHWLNNIKKCQK